MLHSSNCHQLACPTKWHKGFSKLRDYSLRSLVSNKNMRQCNFKCIQLSISLRFLWLYSQKLWAESQCAQLCFKRAIRHKYPTTWVILNKYPTTWVILKVAAWSSIHHWDWIWPVKENKLSTSKSHSFCMDYDTCEYANDSRCSSIISY